MSGRRAGIAAACLAIPYVPFVVGADPGEGFLGAVLVGGAGLVAPGLVGAAAGRPAANAARRVTRGLLAAVGLNVMAAVVLKLAGGTPSPALFAAVLGGLVVSSGALVFGRGGSLPDPRRHRLVVVVALAAFALAFFAGTQVVPPLEDQDTEVQGTAYGLAHDLEPICLTNRSTLYFFAHPLLLHALNASTLTLSGDLETVRPPYEAAVAELDKLPPEARARGIGAAVAALKEPAPRPDRYIAWRRGVYAPFGKAPALFGTRAPNFVLAAVAAALLLGLARRLGARPFDAVLVVAAYATLPEIFVRSGYGGYYALTAVTFLAGAQLAAGGAGGARAGVAAGALAILSNQKALILVAATVGARALSGVAGRSVGRLRPAVPLLVGMVAGGAAFWMYGLGLAPHEFVADHLLDHGFRRFSGVEALNRAGHALYPSRLALWGEFAGHMGWGWTAAAVVALGVGAVRGVRGVRRAIGSGDTRSMLTLHLVAWVLVGAVLFTATDWRQTKHLCLLVPALSGLIVATLARAPRTGRFALRGVLGASIVWNVIWMGRLACDFESLAISTEW